MKYVLITLTAFAALMTYAQQSNAVEARLSDGTVVEIQLKDSAPDAAVCDAKGFRTGCEVGKVQYCTYFSDSLANETGWTFDRSTMLRDCDTNGDGEYQYCLDYVPHADGGFTFEDQSYYRYCGDDSNWNPTTGRI